MSAEFASILEQHVPRYLLDFINAFCIKSSYDLVGVGVQDIHVALVPLHRLQWALVQHSRCSL